MAWLPEPLAVCAHTWLYLLILHISRVCVCACVCSPGVLRVLKPAAIESKTPSSHPPQSAGSLALLGCPSTQVRKLYISLFPSVSPPLHLSYFFYLFLPVFCDQLLITEVETKQRQKLLLEHSWGMLSQPRRGIHGLRWSSRCSSYLMANQYLSTPGNFTESLLRPSMATLRFTSHLKGFKDLKLHTWSGNNDLWDLFNIYLEDHRRLTGDSFRVDGG